MPRQSAFFLAFLGAGFGLLWGLVSLELWTFNQHPPAVLVAPLWITFMLASQLPVGPLLVGVLVSVALGLVPVLALLVIARVRGW
jgi:hypothetical protein